MPQLERLSPVAEALGWCGRILPAVDLLGDRVDVVYKWDDQAHFDRERAGVPALADPWILRCATDLDPDLLVHPCPTQMVGILVQRASWQIGRRVAAGFAGLSQTAVLLSRSDGLIAADADRLGIGLVRVGDGQTVVVPPARYVAPTWTLVQRLAQEQIYSLAVSQFAAARS